MRLVHYIEDSLSSSKCESQYLTLVATAKSSMHGEATGTETLESAGHGDKRADQVPAFSKCQE